MAVLMTALAAVVALFGVFVAGIVRSHAVIVRPASSLGVDSRSAIDVVGVTPTGDSVMIAIAGSRGLTLLAFLTSVCTTCAEFWSAFADKRSLRVPGAARLAIVTKGTEGESPSRLRTLVPNDVPVVMSSEAWKAFGVSVAPYFVIVDGPTERVIGEGAAATWPQAVAMIEVAARARGVTL